MRKETATFGGGCFWCIEAIVERLKGVETVVSGFAGGTAPGHPTYREVCSGLTGHAEIVEVTFDAEIISFRDLVLVFMTSHNPTLLNRQGADIGTAYRSIIQYHSEEQKQTIEELFQELKASYSNPIVTEVMKATEFFPAETPHQGYYRNNSTAPYCTAVIDPKIAKLRAMYAHLLKPDNM
ncbi:MAG: peptide-methionine (S)-S-oxide reductase MsrA [Flavobacteriales bacterium]